MLVLVSNGSSNISDSSNSSVGNAHTYASRMRHNKTIGDRRVKIVQLHYMVRGYVPLAYGSEHGGVDIIVFGRDYPQVIEVIECTNWASTRWHLSPERLDGYIRNLDYFDFLRPRPLKTIMVSFIENLGDGVLKLREHNIRVLECGYQDTPETLRLALKKLAELRKRDKKDAEGGTET